MRAEAEAVAARAAAQRDGSSDGTSSRRIRRASRGSTSVILDRVDRVGGEATRAQDRKSDRRAFAARVCPGEDKFFLVSVLSHEHDAMTWAPYDEAHALLRWENNQVALWRLDERLLRGQLPPAE